MDVTFKYFSIHHCCDYALTSHFNKIDTPAQHYYFHHYFRYYQPGDSVKEQVDRKKKTVLCKVNNNNYKFETKSLNFNLTLWQYDIFSAPTTV